MDLVFWFMHEAHFNGILTFALILTSFYHLCYCFNKLLSLDRFLVSKYNNESKL